LKVGVVLPMFEPTPALALDVTRRAEADGVDGVFCYDHLVPLRRPDRPTLSSVPMLAAVAAITSRVRLGPLVSRVSLLPDALLVEALVTIDRLAEGRLIAGLGAGDHLNRAEQAPYGVAFPDLTERLARLETVTSELAGRGIHTWIGGRSRPVRELAARVAAGWNCWEGPAAELATFSPLPGRPIELTWGGEPPEHGQLVEHLQEMARLGVAWVIYGPRPDVDWPRFMAKMAGAAEAVR
jgi:alkanesulfonate monooxygenase SsuD/methylene tetrahydromethanopterin reductase-like flavin-dependent oxidoreductase (luciferase family)